MVKSDPAGVCDLCGVSCPRRGICVSEVETSTATVIPRGSSRTYSVEGGDLLSPGVTLVLETEVFLVGLVNPREVDRSFRKHPGPTLDTVDGVPPSFFCRKEERGHFGLG